MKTPKFGKGDKVFAKVRGYPPWPASINGLADETPNRMKYHVYFYGTGETAVVKAEDICSFVENKAKLGKPKKHKGFTEAVNDIIQKLSDEDRMKLKELEEMAKGDANVSTSEDKETPKGGGNRRTSTTNKQSASKQPLSPNSTPKPKSEKKKRKAEPESPAVEEADEPQQPEPKKVKTSVPPPAPAQPTTVSPPASPGGQAPSVTESSDKSPDKSDKSSEVMSRSGRKIKPKRFADFDDPVAAEDSPQSTTTKPQKSTKTGKTSDKDGEDYLLAMKDKEKIQIPLKLNRPQFDSIKSAAEWDDSVLKYAMSLKRQIEAGEFTESIDTHMDNWTKEKAAALPLIAQVTPTKLSRKELEDKMESFSIESQLLDIDIQIKEALNLRKADTKRCLQLLDSLLNINISALMLKKHPDLVHTIKKLRRYIGNMQAWQMSEEERASFTKSASDIRLKADQVYNKFKTYFLVPSNKSFWDFFASELVEFSKRTKHLSIEQVFAITEEPSF